MDGSEERVVAWSVGADSDLSGDGDGGRVGGADPEVAEKEEE
jgi:hypothetical protein